MLFNRTKYAAYALGAVVAAAGVATCQADTDVNPSKLAFIADEPGWSATSTVTGSCERKTKASGVSSLSSSALGLAEGSNFQMAQGEVAVCRVRAFGSWHETGKSSVSATATTTQLRPIETITPAAGTGNVVAQLEGTPTHIVNNVKGAGSLASSAIAHGESDTVSGGIRTVDASGSADVVCNADVLITAFQYSVTYVEVSAQAEADASKITHGEALGQASAQGVCTAQHWFPTRGQAAIQAAAQAQAATVYRITKAVADISNSVAATDTGAIAYGVTSEPCIAKAQTSVSATKMRIAAPLPSISTVTASALAISTKLAAGSFQASCTATGANRVNDYTIAPPERTFLIPREPRTFEIPREPRTFEVA